ncbi:MAG: hypothetical protein LBQ28_05495 [Prevotellaceae bacterium]|nr:hypothetical protein [Prevotellaceae bacterium]
MDRVSRHAGEKAKKWKNIVPLFQPAYSPELNPVEHLCHCIRENGGFKNKTFNSLSEVEMQLMTELDNLSKNKNTVKSIILFL